MPGAALFLAHASPPIWSCSVWGLPCLLHYCRSGALLPHLFTLTRRGERYILCGTGRPQALKPASRTLSGTLPCGVRTFLPRISPFWRRKTAATAQSSCHGIVYGVLRNKVSVCLSAGWQSPGRICFPRQHFPKCGRANRRPAAVQRGFKKSQRHLASIESGAKSKFFFTMQTIRANM